MLYSGIAVKIETAKIETLDEELNSMLRMFRERLVGVGSCPPNEDLVDLSNTAGTDVLVQ